MHLYVSPRSAYQFRLAPRLTSQNCNFQKVPSPDNSHKKLYERKKYESFLLSLTFFLIFFSSQLVTATALVPRIIFVICRQASAHAESRLADDSATSVLLVTGAFLSVDHAAATDTTRPTAIPGLACV